MANLLRKVLTLFAGILLVGSSGVMTTPVFAEDEPVVKTTFDSTATGTLTLRYFDDSDETLPVKGADFTIYQVATIGHGVADSGKYQPLNDSIDFRNVVDLNQNEKEQDAQHEEDRTSAEDYEKAVKSLYQAKPDIGMKVDIKIGDDGVGKATGLVPGAYLVSENGAVRYHNRSLPFIVSVPEMNKDGTSWNFDVVANPKARTAGDLSVTKHIVGNRAKKSDLFGFKVSLPNGSYRIKLPDGSESTVMNHDVIYMAGGQSFTIYDLPAGKEYEVVELEANTGGYVTTYSNAKGTISEKSETMAVVTNTKDVTIATWVKGHPLTIAELMVASVTLLLVVLFAKKKEKDAKVQK